ncbi:hypothetical protein N8K70_06970 [Microbacterium betulae]|uniref:Fumarate reductase subunit D n=1 Tax=Microbacterium betulae TaxID=2981139 RepID=A0AA97FK30_9MICO|nr:fumarate reductase subunit FrdD [Microbacterium sp. AB]WOF24401.1 hypothetical protein N8K70_06970 [Microbacterium sp. AB]
MMRQWKGRTAEPVRWALFGAGGMVSVFAMPVLLLVLGILMPLGAFGGSDGVLAKVGGLLTHPFVVLVVCAGLAVVLWHCCHRIVHGLHDLKVHPPKIVEAAIYAFAVAVPVVALALCLIA